MNFKSAAGMIALAAFLFAASPTLAQVDENVGGHFYDGCAPTSGPGVIMILDNGLQIIVYNVPLKPDEAYRTKGEVFDGEPETMMVNKCDSKMENCQSVEGVLTTYKADGAEIEAAIEYFDGTETQGDAESVQGKTSYFTVKKEKGRAAPVCG